MNAIRTQQVNEPTAHESKPAKHAGRLTRPGTESKIPATDGFENQIAYHKMF
jgi:hypothetical protein